MRVFSFILVPILAGCALVSEKPVSERDLPGGCALVAEDINLDSRDNLGFEYYRVGRHLPELTNNAIEMLPHGLDESHSGFQVDFSGFAVVVPVTADLVRISWVENRSFSTRKVSGFLGTIDSASEYGPSYYNFLGGIASVGDVYSPVRNEKMSRTFKTHCRGAVAAEIRLTGIDLVASDPSASFTIKDLKIEQAFLTVGQLTSQRWALDYYNRVDGSESELMCGLNPNRLSSKVSVSYDENGVLISADLKERGVEIATFSVRNSKSYDKNLSGFADVNFGNYSGRYPVEFYDGYLDHVSGRIKLPDCDISLQYARTQNWENRNLGWETVYELDLTKGGSFSDVGIIVQ